jgi:hypothetical protein
MPSYVHELLLLLFRNRSRSAADLLRVLDVQVPEYDEVCIESSDLNHLEPAEYRADLAVLLLKGTRRALGVIVEIQLQTDEDKRYAWPAYVTNFRARHRCPVCLLVVTIEDSVARWAAQPIELGPENWFRACVVGPANAPAVTEPHVAEENVEFAVLSAVEHASSPNVELAARVTSAAIAASAGIDAERSRMYLDLIMIILSKNAQGALQNMNSLGFEYQSDFARKYVAQGRAEGRAEVLLELLALRFGPLAADVQDQIRAAERPQLDMLAKNLLTASTLQEALQPLG